MRTGTTEWSGEEFRLIPMECGWVKSKNKEKDKSKGKGNENPSSQSGQEMGSQGNRLTEFEVEYLCQKVGCARNKPQFKTDPQMLNKFLEGLPVWSREEA